MVMKLVEVEVEGGLEMERHGPASVDCSPGAMVMKLAEVYGSVEMERLSVEKEKMAMENLGETDEDDNRPMVSRSLAVSLIS
jgi:hypothetical protein